MVGVIGLGGMGSGIASTLARGGYDLVVYDIDPARAAPLVATGGAVAAAADIADLCSRADSVILSLPSSRVTVDVIEHQIAPASRSGTTVIDMGTTTVRETRRLHALLAARGVALVDAPVSGGTAGAAKGELFVFVGGDKPAVDASWPTLQALGGGRLTHCGPSGAGQVTKAVNQLAMGLVDAAFIEAVAFGVNGGVDAATLKEAVGGESGWRAHLAQIAGRVADGDGDANDVKYAEFAYFLDFAHSQDFPAPMLDALHAYMSQFPETARDNMNRPYPPLWSALTGASEPEGAKT
ncbi:MAG: NAD(P)-dependent oxidoreductase [Spirochaetaceae bacterium]|nr:MAG: NAD(P)-dependent oxidoreductase [Spirochaetaceae bacterium]